jgi:protein-S-isoprenylcysteine O-methyltransferase Ste14
MFDTEAIAILLDKVPDLRSPWRILLTVAYVLLLSAACAFFFFAVDRLAWFAPILSQAAMALLVTLIAYLHFEWVGAYRRRYSSLAYRYYFYHLIIPYLVTWYACFFHPLFVSGPALLPGWLAIALGLVLLLLFLLATIHIERAGFAVVTYGMDLYTLFPEEATPVYGEIYGFIRHPLYFSLICGSLGLALMRNNGVALLVSALQLLPALSAATMEDREMIAREGQAHQDYIRRTAAIIPLRRLGGFLKLLFFIG